MTEPESEPHAHRLIREAAGGRTLPDEDVRAIREHVAARGFDPDARERIGGRGSGIEWNGRVLRGSDRLPPAEVHYIRHVLHEPEWPAGTSLDDYIEDVRNAVLAPDSGVFLSNYSGEQQLAFVRQVASAGARLPWLLVEFRISYRFITTAHRRDSLDDILDDDRRRDVRWLYKPM